MVAALGSSASRAEAPIALLSLYRPSAEHGGSHTDELQEDQAGRSTPSALVIKLAAFDGLETFPLMTAVPTAFLPERSGFRSGAFCV